jgi:hypothetical protein
MRDEPRGQGPVAKILLTDAALGNSRIYREYRLHINGEIIRRQICPIDRGVIQWECQKRMLVVPAEYAEAVPSQPRNGPEIREVTGRWARQETPAQQQQAQDYRNGGVGMSPEMRAIEEKDDPARRLLDMTSRAFPEGSAERLLWRICASHRCPGLINGEAALCEAFHAEALDVLTRALAKVSA